MRIRIDSRPGFLAALLALAACGAEQNTSDAPVSDAGAGENAAAEKSAATPSDPAAPSVSGSGGEADAGTISARDKALPARDTAILEAAGLHFVTTRDQWESGACGDPPMGSYEGGGVSEVRDINGDGRPEAIVMETGICYGNIGMRFWLLTQQADGKWKVMTDSIAIPNLLETRGVDNFPDILGGGPGFCFPVARWNGQEYRLHRHEYEGKPCSIPQ